MKRRRDRKEGVFTAAHPRNLFQGKYHTRPAIYRYRPMKPTPLPVGRMLMCLSTGMSVNFCCANFDGTDDTLF